MKYAKNSNLRKNLLNIVKDRWIIKLLQLNNIISGLDEIHQKSLIHCDFHHGNILNIHNKVLSISDLGLCKPVEYFQSSKNNDIYGVLPFVAPEVLRGQPYNLASDIYSFSIIMWEFISGVPPFDNEAHDFQLSLDICKGKRPEIIKNIPQCYINLMKKCWDMDPLKRPTASEIKKIIENWKKNIINKDFEKELKNDILDFYKADKVLKQIQNNNVINDKVTVKSHPQAYHTSQLLNFTEKLNKDLNQNIINIEEISQSIGNYIN